MKYIKLIFCAVFLKILVFGVLFYANRQDGDGVQIQEAKYNSRNLLAANENKNCTPKKSENFPNDFFTEEEKRSGLIFVHILIVAYLMGSLALVCDRYFMASMEVLCERLDLSEDVAGATFMAIGTSAPEFATAIIGVFVTESDVGIDTVAGSTVYNMFFITAACCLTANTIIKIKLWAVLRDSVFFVIATVALFLILSDGKVYWYEGLIVTIIYILYIAFMVFSNRLEIIFYEIFKIKKRYDEEIDLEKEREEEAEEEEEEEETPLIEKDMAKEVDNQKYDALKDQNNIDVEPKSRYRCQSECRVSYRKRGNTQQKCLTDGNRRTRSPSCNNKHDDHLGIDEIYLYGQYDDDVTLKPSLSVTTLNEIGTGEYQSPMMPPYGFFKTLMWLIFLPMSFLLYVTIPDCRKYGFWVKLFPVTFFMSIVWIGAISYVLIWMIEVIGETFDIPEPIMGITFLAIGSSLPDTFAALVATKMGYGEMAISSILGSNIFDLMCTGFPWLLKTIIYNSIIDTNSQSLFFTLSSLLISVLIVLLFFIFSRWKLTKLVGYIFLIFYGLFVILAVLYQLNYFGPVNLPYCPK